VTTVDRAIGLLVASLATLGLVWMSQVPVASDRTGEATLRLTWRARPERIEHCVAQNPEALAALPPHMRQTTICEGRSASYQLEVRREGELLAAQLVMPGGLRRDRPLYVFRDLPVPAGTGTFRVTFTRVEVAAASADRDEGAEERDTLREAVPPFLTWERVLTFAPRQVRVISYGPAQRELAEVPRP
jgi:hypothetical protein